MSRTLITIGIIIVIIGLLWPVFQKMNLGRLPGDIIIRRDGFRFYFPITTSIVISILLTIVFWIFRK